MGVLAARVAPVAPEPLAMAPDLIVQQLATRLAGGAETAQQMVELQHDRPQRLRLGDLSGVDAVTGPDHKAEHEREQQGDDAGYKSYLAACVGYDGDGDRELHGEADASAREGRGGGDEEASGQGGVHGACRSAQAALWVTASKLWPSGSNTKAA